eukprot:2527980-Prymnesium_polylepis.1
MYRDGPRSEVRGPRSEVRLRALERRTDNRTGREVRGVTSDMESSNTEHRPTSVCPRTPPHGATLALRGVPLVPYAARLEVPAACRRTRRPPVPTGVTSSAISRHLSGDFWH